GHSSEVPSKLLAIAPFRYKSDPATDIVKLISSFDLEPGAGLPDVGSPTTHGRYRLGSATRTSNTRCVTPSWLLTGLSTSGAENLSSRCRLEPVPYGLNRNACVT